MTTFNTLSLQMFLTERNAPQRRDFTETNFEKINYVWNNEAPRNKYTPRVDDINHQNSIEDKNSLENHVKQEPMHLPVPIISKHGELKWERPFPVKGQGVVVYSTSTQSPFAICIQSTSSDNWISLDIHENFVVFFMKKGNYIYPLNMVSGSGCGLEKGGSISYWFSYDRDRLTLKYGKGYRMEETTLLVYDFLKDAKLPKEDSNIREQLHPFFNAEHQIVAKQFDIPYPSIEEQPFLSSVYDAEAEGKNRFLDSVYDVEPDVQFDRNPFVRNIPPLVLDSSRITLDKLDGGQFCFSASLPPVCRELYENVKGCKWSDTKNIKGLGNEDCGTDLAEAIRHSIRTEGCSLYKKLKKKSEQFGSDPQTTYLRITLGQEFGNSPGTPYVLEIWPSKHHSPIHNHGNADAAIKVLFGKIHIQIFNKHILDTDAKPLKEFDANTGDVTWIDRNWYQTHRLVNMSDDFCATIQCYKYDEQECTHWPYFDYISETSGIKHFLPGSDFGFQEMCKTVMKEYTAEVVMKT